jgi:microcystin degradation protein MlrC
MLGVLQMKRIFTAGISQESNSFNPLMSVYEDFNVIKGQQFRDLPGVKILISAGYEVVESVYFRAVPGGTLKFNDFMRMTDEMLQPLVDDHIGFDGVFLPMHGALDVEHIGSGEAFIASRVREIVGPDVPISAPLDMHANIMYGMADTCNIIYGYRTAPHVDAMETHIRAAELLFKAVRENVIPRTELIRIPYMMPGENMMTESGIGKEIIAFLPKIEREKNVWCASYFVGMTWVDCPQNGAAVVITGLGDISGGIAKGKELAKFVWDNRDRFEYQGIALEPEDAVEFVIKHQNDRPVILSDSADNVTAGAAGDNALMLKLFIENRVEKALFSAVIDPVAVEKCGGYKVDDVIDIEIGGAFDVNSTKVMLNGAVVKKAVSHVHNYKSCVLSYKGIDILLFNKRRPVFTEQTLNEHGLTMNDYNILVVKQGYLNPEFLKAAKHSVMAYTPGNCNQKVERLEFKKLRRPIYPIDDAGMVDF